MPAIDLFSKASSSPSKPLHATSERTNSLVSLFCALEKGIKLVFLQRPSTYFLAGAVSLTLVLIYVVMSNGRRRSSSDEIWSDEKSDSTCSHGEDTVGRKHGVRHTSEGLLGLDIQGTGILPAIATTDGKQQYQQGVRQSSSPAGSYFLPPGLPPLPFPNMLANILPHPTVHPFDHHPSPPPSEPLTAAPPLPPLASSLTPQQLHYQDRKVIAYWTDPQQQLQKQEHISMVWKAPGGLRRHIRIYGS